MGVLVAVSIPIFTSQLEKAREATDLANIRSAYAAGQTAALTGSISDSADVDPDATYYYDTAAGVLTTTAPAKTWFQGTANGSGDKTTIGTIEYDTKKAYTSLTIKFTGTNAPYTVTYTLN